VAINKEQWQEVENELAGFLGQAVFMYQGQKIQVSRVCTGEGKMDLGVYIDGVMNFSWGRPKGRNTEGENFRPVVELIWRKRSRSYYSPRHQKEIVKVWGKRKAKKEFPDLESRYEWFDPVFLTTASLVRQYKRIKGLELISVGYVAEADT